ncbi:hypothetical protein ACR75N_04860 [Parabacteroides merdae]|uniref:hypothetical protein n=1 Tax=Parabacteroides merdae TaxID=46503 RepID=UPI003DA2DBCF
MAVTVTALGLTKIEVANIGSDGAPGEYATLGKTYEGTCNMVDEDPTTTEFYCEEEDEPVVSIAKKGKTTINWSIMNADANVMKKIFGGKVIEAVPGTSGAIWEAPAKMEAKELAVKLTPYIGCTFEIARASVTAKINGNFGKNDIFLVDMILTVLTPIGERPRIRMTEPTPEAVQQANVSSEEPQGGQSDPVE